MKEWMVTEENNLKDFTDSHDPQASFFFDRLLKAREIKINGERVAAGGSRTLLKSGDKSLLLSDACAGGNDGVRYGVRGRKSSGNG